MIVFQVSLNFDPAKEILKIMKKGIILRKIHVTIKYFVPPFLKPFQFEPEQKKTYPNESQGKETKHVHASAADLLHIRIGNLDSDIAKTKPGK